MSGIFTNFVFRLGSRRRGIRFLARGGRNIVLIQMFDTPVDIFAWLLLGLAAAGLSVSCLYGLKAYFKASSFVNPPLPAEDEARPKASVLIYCQSDEETLEATVAAVAAQDYPDFEIIVVCDASAEYAELLQERFAGLYGNVYVTFVQPGSHNLSRRKLANTIGVKAAKGEIIVTTRANIVVPSESWLSSIMAPFCGEAGKHKDVVLGVSRIDFSQMRGPGKWYGQFDSLLTDGLWIGYAAARKAYRGDGNNLAFRREVFFRHKGYARTINLHNGDDDLFINEISTSGNTAVTVGPESIIETSWPGSANRVRSILKERYSFTARWLPHAPFVRSGVQMALQWIVPVSAGFAAWLGLPNIIPALAGAVVLLAFWGTEIYCYRRLAGRLGGVRLWWAVVPFWLWRPIGDLVFRYDHRYSRKKNFTWQR